MNEKLIINNYSILINKSIFIQHFFKPDMQNYSYECAFVKTSDQCVVIPNRSKTTLIMG